MGAVLRRKKLQSRHVHSFESVTIRYDPAEQTGARALPSAWFEAQEMEPERESHVSQVPGGQKPASRHRVLPFA
jgi:hypothetical protein